MAREKKKSKTENQQPEEHNPQAEKKKSKTENQQPEEHNPQAEERKRLKELVRTTKILSETPAKGSIQLTPSKIVVKYNGTDIIKKSQRKNRYLFSFNGLLAPISGGKIGELTDLASKNPILYLDFPQGRMKLLGTIVYPKNRYLTLQFSKVGKNVMCEDCFDAMIVFSDAYWVGKKDENPDEARLDFPEELYESKQSEFDFQGGAGAGVSEMENRIAKKVAATPIEEEPLCDLLIDETETQSPEREENMKDLEYTTPPVRQSERTAGKRFKFTEVSSGDDSGGSASDTSAEQHDEVAKNDLNLGIPETAVEEDAQQSTVQAPISSLLTSEKAKSSRSSLVQATISTLFKKVQQKSTQDTLKMVPEKDSKKTTQPNSSKPKNRSVKMQLVPKADQLPKERNTSQLRRAGATSTKNKRNAEAAEVEDDIVEFSSVSQDTD